MKTLLVGSPLCSKQEIELKHKELSASSTVSFEQLDRIEQVELGKYDLITTMRAGIHPAKMLVTLAKALNPGGTIQFTELVISILN